MNNLDAEYKLKKQYWYYGVLPLVSVYLVGIYFAGYNFGVSVDDCFISQSCPDGMSKRRYVSSIILKIIMLILTLYALWNTYRVFKLSREGIDKNKKIRARIYVILFPVIAIIASPFLALFTNYYLTRNAYYDFIHYIVHKIPISLVP